LPTGSKSGNKLELDAIRTQSALAAERAKLNIAGGQPAAGPSGPMVPAITAQPIAVTPGGRGSSNSAAAQVTMVAGSEGQLSATIQTAHGLIVARVGDKLPDIGIVRSIAANQVMVEDGKKTRSLPFAAEPASALIQGGMAQGVNTLPPALLPFGAQ
jgi:type IV pilus biogenesis protein PilP